MKITVLMGSPNRNGSTAILVENFARGAEEAGHAVDVVDVCHADIHNFWRMDTRDFSHERKCAITLPPLFIEHTFAFLPLLCYNYLKEAAN